MTTTIDRADNGDAGIAPNAKRLLWAGFMAIFAAGFGSLAWHIYRLVRGWTLLNEGKPAVGVLSPPRW